MLWVNITNSVYVDELSEVLLSDKDNLNKYKMSFLNDLNHLFKRVIQTYLALCGKSNFPLNLITGCGALGSKNCNIVFVITGNQCFISLWGNFGVLFFAELF